MMRNGSGSFWDRADKNITTRNVKMACEVRSCEKAADDLRKVLETGKITGYFRAFFRFVRTIPKHLAGYYSERTETYQKTMFMAKMN